MGRGRSKEKVYQAFLQRKCLLGGYLTLCKKEEMRTVQCQGSWPPGTAREAVGTAIVELVAWRPSPGDDFDSCAHREALALRSRRGRSTTGPDSRRRRGHRSLPIQFFGRFARLANQK
jgi:hypothetical protein